MLQLALRSALPLVAVATTDLLNLPTILQHLAKRPAQRFTLTKDSLTPIQPKGLYFLVLGEGKALPDDLSQVYEKLVDKEATLVVVNLPKPHHLCFDAGVVPVPQTLVRQTLEEVFENKQVVAGLLPVLGGCTLKDVGELVRLTFARDKGCTPEGLMRTRQMSFRPQGGLTLVDPTHGFYQPPHFLEHWLAQEKPYFLGGSDPRLIPRGLMFAGQPGTGKCLAPHEPVLMYDGRIRRTDALVPGDLVMGPDSEPRRVLTTNPGFGPMYQVTPVKGTPWQCNGDHILSLRACRGGEKGSVVFVTVEEWLSWSGYRKASYKLWRTGVDFPARPKPLIDPWLVGMVLGDGSVREGIRIHSVEPEVEQELERVAQRNGVMLRKSVHQAKSCPTYQLSMGLVGGGGRAAGSARSLCLNRVLHGLRRYGLEVPCTHKFIPDDYKLGSRAVRLDVLAGLIDSDGHLSTGSYDFVSKSRQLAEDVTFVARSLGLAAYCKPVQKICTNNGVAGSYWRVSISGEIGEVPCRVARKRAPARRQRKLVTHTGFTVTPLGAGPWFGITLDGDHQYLLGDFTVTHNTAGARWLAKEMGVPLYRLDIGTTKSKLLGESERQMRQALDKLDQEEPCIVLLDEVEKAFSKEHGHGDSGTTTGLLSQLLWWLAEHRSRVLTVMTCNNQQVIPQELYRPGRIDEVFQFRGFTQLEDCVAFGTRVVAGFGLEAAPFKLAKLLQPRWSQAIDTQPWGALSQAEIEQLTIQAIKAHGLLQSAA